MRLNNAVNSFPVSFTANGKQYVAVRTGGGSGFCVRSAAGPRSISGERLDALGLALGN